MHVCILHLGGDSKAPAFVRHDVILSEWPEPNVASIVISEEFAESQNSQYQEFRISLNYPYTITGVQSCNSRVAIAALIREQNSFTTLTR